MAQRQLNPLDRICYATAMAVLIAVGSTVSFDRNFYSPAIKDYSAAKIYNMKLDKVREAYAKNPVKVDKLEALLAE